MTISTGNVEGDDGTALGQAVAFAGQDAEVLSEGRSRLLVQSVRGAGRNPQVGEGGRLDLPGERGKGGRAPIDHGHLFSQSQGLDL